MIRMILPDGTVVHKIGMVNTYRATDRMMEILRSWFTAFRFVPYSELKLDMECGQALELEKYIHWLLKNNRFEPSKKVSGGTEMFTEIDEIRVIHFLKNYENSIFRTPPKMTEKERAVINQLLSL